MIRFLAASAMALAIISTATAQTVAASIVIRDHKFTPAQIEVPAGRKIELRVMNADPTVEEFESPELHREKAIAPGAEELIYVGPLRAGSYDFLGEFNPETAKGRIVAK